MIWINLAILIFLVKFHRTTQMQPTQFASEGENKSAMVTVQVETSMFPSRFNFEDTVNISEECYKLGYCEDVDDYPEELAEKLLREMQEDKFLVSTMQTEPEETVSFGSRFGGDQIDAGENPCRTEKKTIKPRLLRDNGKWYRVLNPRSGIQRFSVELCEHITSPGISEMCSRDMYIDANFVSSCEQKYIYFNVNIIMDDRVVAKKFKLPCCCSCVGIRNH